MRWQWSLVAALTGAGLTVWTCRSAAQGETERSTDVVGGDPNPQKNKSTNVAVVFEPSATNLPQAAIRDAVARELGMPPDRTVVAARRELSIGVEERELVVRFTSPDGRVERRVAMPDDASQTPELVRLIAGNIARDQGALDAGAPHHDAPPVASAAASVTNVVAPPKPDFRRHWVGLHFAQDVMYEPGAYVCDAAASSPTYSCFLAGTGEPYKPNSASSQRSVSRGFSLATPRLLGSYDYAFSPAFTLGGRFGFAFKGGPSGRAPDSGIKGTPFWPAHFEVRGTWWFAPLTNRRVRGFVGGGAGVAQFDAKSKYGAVCGLGAGTASTEIGSDACYSYNNATNPPTFSGPPVQLDVWRKVGRGFVAMRSGVELRLWDELGVELDVHAIAAFPAFGVVIEPSVGVVYGL